METHTVFYTVMGALVTVCMMLAFAPKQKKVGTHTGLELMIISALFMIALIAAVIHFAF